MNLLGIDTETGGLSDGASLLTLQLSVYSSDAKELLDSFNIKLKPDPIHGRTVYQIEAEALEINKIDLIEHDKVAITYKESKKLIYDFLFQSSQKYGKLIPFGQNVAEDIKLITDSTISIDTWNSFCSRKVIDTVALGVFAQLKGKIPFEQSLGLGSVCNHLGISVDLSKLHSEEYDVQLNAELIKWHLENN